MKKAIRWGVAPRLMASDLYDLPKLQTGTVTGMVTTTVMLTTGTRTGTVVMSEFVKLESIARSFSVKG
jgi:hypothetical protein